MRGANNIKLKHIRSFLDDIDQFDYGEKEKWKWEQHRTPPDIAANLLHHINLTHDLENCIVCDLGVGTGTFLAGLLFLGVPYAVGYQIDEKYLKMACEAIDEKLDSPTYDVVLADISQMPLPCHPIFDIVVMNPPFGTKEAGIDMKFLEFATKTCQGSIYSFHKTSTIDFIRNKVESWGYSLKVLETVKFPLPKRFGSYHKKDMAYTQVDVICLSKK